MSDNELWYPEQPPKFAESGEFEAVVLALDKPPSSGAQGHSYASFAIRRGGAEQFEYRVVASRGASEEYRAYVAAVVGVLETLPGDASVDIFTHHKLLVANFNDRVPDWEANGWKKADNKPPKALDILQRYSTVKRGRGLTVKLIYVPKNDFGLYAVFNQLKSRIDRYVERQFPERP